MISSDSTEHAYMVRVGGRYLLTEDYSLAYEYGTGRRLGETDPVDDDREDRISIVHNRAHEYVLDLSTDEAVVENAEVCMNRRYDCGHVAYGPPRRLPRNCPECKPVATDGGTERCLVTVDSETHKGEWLRMVACPIPHCDAFQGTDYERFSSHLAAEHGPEDVGLSSDGRRVATDGGTDMDGTEHEFDVGDVFEDVAGRPWEVTNRMVDVDTGEHLYYLQGTDPDEWNHNENEVVPEAVLTRDSSAWWHVHTATDANGGDS